jgi:hypothetical protein
MKGLCEFFSVAFAGGGLKTAEMLLGSLLVRFHCRFIGAGISSINLVAQTVMGGSLYVLLVPWGIRGSRLTPSSPQLASLSSGEKASCRGR